jgi:hypothetical protein
VGAATGVVAVGWAGAFVAAVEAASDAEEEEEEEAMGVADWPVQMRKGRGRNV